MHLYTVTFLSDGSVKIFRWFWKDEGFKLNLELELSAHTYPALAVDFGANDALLLSAGLDGCARLWDIMVSNYTKNTRLFSDEKSIIT